MRQTDIDYGIEVGKSALHQSCCIFATDILTSLLHLE